MALSVAHRSVRFGSMGLRAFQIDGTVLDAASQAQGFGSGGREARGSTGLRSNAVCSCTVDPRCIVRFL